MQSKNVKKNHRPHIKRSLCYFSGLACIPDQTFPTNDADGTYEIPKRELCRLPRKPNPMDAGQIVINIQGSVTQNHSVDKAGHPIVRRGKQLRC